MTIKEEVKQLHLEVSQLRPGPGLGRAVASDVRHRRAVVPCDGRCSVVAVVVDSAMARAVPASIWYRTPDSVLSWRRNTVNDVMGW